jgi:hypothetical protein
MKVTNEKILLKNKAFSFYTWKFASLIDKKAENKKLQMYFLNNAKIEV